MPPTLALSLWSLGRKEEAVQWYAAAVRSEPQLWNTTAQFARLLPEWSEADRAELDRALETCDRLARQLHADDYAARG